MLRGVLLNSDLLTVISPRQLAYDAALEAVGRASVSLGRYASRHRHHTPRGQPRVARRRDRHGRDRAALLGAIGLDKRSDMLPKEPTALARGLTTLFRTVLAGTETFDLAVGIHGSSTAGLR